MVSVDGLRRYNEILDQFQFRVPLAGIGLNYLGIRWMVSMCQQLRRRLHLLPFVSVVLGVRTT